MIYVKINFRRLEEVKKDVSLGLSVFAITLAFLIGIDPMVHSVFASTGGSEVQVVWDKVSQALQGYWGKIFAAIFIAIAILSAKGGNVIGAVVFVIIGLIIGKIPDIVNTAYTGTF